MRVPIGAFKLGVEPPLWGCDMMKQSEAVVGLALKQVGTLVFVDPELWPGVKADIESVRRVKASDLPYYSAAPDLLEIYADWSIDQLDRLLSVGGVAADLGGLK